MRRRSESLLAILAVAVALGCTDKPETLVQEYDEAEMEKAIQQARATFDEFLERFHDPQPGDEGFAVKVRIEDANGVEHFWLLDLQLKTEPYSGTIDNDPGIVKSVKAGQKYTFSRADVSDWMYMSNKTMQGNRTLRVTLKSMPKEKAEALKRAIGW